MQFQYFAVVQTMATSVHRRRQNYVTTSALRRRQNYVTTSDLCHLYRYPSNSIELETMLESYVIEVL